MKVTVRNHHARGAPSRAPLPAAIPVVIGAEKSTRIVFFRAPFHCTGCWLRLRAAFALVFSVASWVAFEYVLE